MFLIITLLICILICTIPFFFIPLPMWFWVIWGFSSIVMGILLFVLIILLFFFIAQNTNPKNKFKHIVLRSACGIWLRYFHVKLELYGKENILDNNERYVIYSNHKSMIDPMAIYYALNQRISAIGKKTLFNNWFMKMLQKTYGAVSIDRDNDRQAVKDMLVAIKEVKDGLPLIIFPEGGIKSRQTEDMVNLRAGAYKLATKSEAKILPISIVGSSECSKVKRTKKKIIKIIVHKAIDKEQYEDKNTTELGLMVEEIINNGVHEYSEK